MRRRLPLWFSVPAGVLAAHAVAYLIAFPDASQRSAILAATGHGYVRNAGLVAIVGAAVALTLAAARGFETRWWDAALRVAALQTGAFIAVEMLERVAVGLGPFAGLARIALIGTFVQLAMAAVVATALKLANRAGRTIADVASQERRPIARFITTILVRTKALAARLDASFASARAPPLAPR